MSDTGVANPPRDFSPFHRTSDTTIWNRAFAQRDAAYRAILDSFERHSVKALVTRSENGRYPPVITVEGWRPAEGGAVPLGNPRIRGTLTLVFEVRPYHEHSLATTARAKVSNREIAVVGRPDFDVRDAVDWALYVVGAKGRPESYRPWSDFFANAIRSVIPFARPLHDNRIERDFHNVLPFGIPMVVGALGLVLLVVGVVTYQDAWREEDIARAIWTMAGGGLLLLAGLILRARQKLLVSVIDRPVVSPRALLMLDSWHAVVPELGKAAADLQRQIADKLANRQGTGIECETERYGFRTPNGFDERDRIVVTKGQGVAHVHVYGFGDDLFIGWDSYLNWACWKETGAISVRNAGMKRTEYRGLEAGLYVPSQFDLIDLNSLAELVHRVVKDVVKTAMEEHKIDQEIDFAIIRGDRDSVLDREKFDKREKTAPGHDGRRARRWRVS